MTEPSQSESNSAPRSGGANAARRRASKRLGETIRRKYTLDALLGVGGMAAVYGATHRNGSRFAIKVMHTEFAREDGVKRRFLREGYVANKVDHPGVVSILDDDETDQGEPFLVMELLEGETLQQRWKRHKRKVPPVEALDVGAQVLDTLIPFHDQRILHRDIKPANIFICLDGTTKILDFGVAQLREGGEDLTRAGTALGTPSFMSPEQAMGKSEQLDARSDVFSLGATLYAILGGQRLHHGKSDNEAFILAATQPAPSLARVAPDLDVELIALVDKALQWDRRRRFRTAADMRDACLSLLTKMGGTIPSRLSGVPPEPVERPSAPTIGASPAARRSPPARARLGSSAPSSGRPRSTRTSDAPSSAPRGEARVSEVTVSPTVDAAPSSATSLSTHTPGSGISAVTSGPGSGRANANPPSGHRRGSQARMDAVAPPSLTELFQRFERVLPPLRQHGLEHPEGQQRLRSLHQTLVTTLRDHHPAGLSIAIHPFCFSYEGAIVWEPAPPLDALPYNLAAAGVEGIFFDAALPSDELATFLECILLDPTLDEDSDIGAALWEAKLEHIRCELRDVLAEADAAEQVRFFAEADDLEAMAREDLAEVAAMAVSTDVSAFQGTGEAHRSALRLGAGLEAALGSQLVGSTERWRERFVEVVGAALVRATALEAPELVAKPLAQHAAVLVSRGELDELIELCQGVVEHVTLQPNAGAQSVDPAAVVDALFPGRVLGELASLGEAETATAKKARDALALAFDYLPGRHVLPLLRRANETFPSSLAELLLAYVEVHIEEHREAVVDLLDDLQPALAQRILATVTASGSDRAVAVLKPLLMSGNPALRCEATALLARSSEALGKELARLLEKNDPKLRRAALTTMTRHGVRSAGPDLVRLVEGEGFSERPEDEQAQLFETLYALSESRAEALLVAIVAKHGVLADDGLDRTRCVAARVLGAHAASEAALAALEDGARLRPWNTPAMRSASTNALESMRARMASEDAS